MRSDNNLFRILALAFLLALILYVATFKWIQHRREHKGPWQVTFQCDNQGMPSILIVQPHLGIDAVQIGFPEQRVPMTNYQRRVSFRNPIKRVPFGELAFQDPTFLPGTVSFNFWGHGVELLPRTLVINQTEIPWVSQTNILLSGEGKFERRPTKKPSIF